MFRKPNACVFYYHFPFHVIYVGEQFSTTLEFGTFEIFSSCFFPLIRDQGHRDGTFDSSLQDSQWILVDERENDATLKKRGQPKRIPNSIFPLI
jgi:hypothetical protein